MVKQTALANGVPRLRYVHAPRSGSGPARVATFYDAMLDALTSPLTTAEREGGRYVPPAQPRVLFEGTLSDAHSFFQQTKPVLMTGRSPICVYSDGLPIVVPTESLVAEMLAGTSHRPDEAITLQSDRTDARGPNKITRRKGTPVKFGPMNWTATVEKVAINAVMAGCKPEYLPVVLAIAESGCPTGTTTFWSEWQCVSGPIVKEIGMNTGYGMLDPGNPANASIGRVYQLMAINLGGAVPGVNRMNSHGSPFNTGGTCFAENVGGLPTGWKGLNEESGFGKNDSVVMVIHETAIGVQGDQFKPSSYRSLQDSGTGGMAIRLGVEGKPGPHNWLRYLLPGMWANRLAPITFLMAPRMAKDLYNFGFKTKDDVYEWIYRQGFVSVGQMKRYADFWTGRRDNSIEETSGKRWKDLPDDYMVPGVGKKPSDNCIIVGGTTEELCLELGGRGFFPDASPIYHIDPWR